MMKKEAYDHSKEMPLIEVVATKYVLCLVASRLFELNQNNDKCYEIGHN